MRATIFSSPTQSASRWLVLTVMCAGYFLVLLDVTVVNVALPAIGSGLNAPISGLQWVVDGYSLPLAALLLTGGSIGDRRGHRRVVLAGFGLFALASLAGALAPSINVLVLARVGQGVGAALLLPGTLAIISRAFPDPGEQARAIGVWAGVGSIGLAGGPVLGGALVQGLGWRWVFLLNVPIVVIAAASAIAVVPSDHPQGSGRIDRAGATLGAVTLGLTTFAVIEAGHAGLTSPVVLAGALAALALAAFMKVEAAVTDPMLPLNLLRVRAFSAANAVALAMNLTTLGLLFLLTMYLQDVQHRDALAAGVAALPLFVPLVVLAPLAGRWTARLGPRPVMLVGWPSTRRERPR